MKGIAVLRSAKPGDDRKQQNGHQADRAADAQGDQTDCQDEEERATETEVPAAVHLTSLLMFGH